MDLLALCISVVSLLFAGLAAYRTLTPPQQRTVLLLASTVSELQAGLNDIAERLTKRSQKENMAKAREVYEGKRERNDAVLAHAAELIEASKGQAPINGQPQQLQFDLATPAGRAAYKAALRRQYGDVIAIPTANERSPVH